jgi:hypothetical protein
MDSKGYFEKGFCAKLFPQLQSAIFFYFRRFLVRFDFIACYFSLNGPSPRHQRLRLDLTNREEPYSMPQRKGSWRSLGTWMLELHMREIMGVLI